MGTVIRLIFIGAAMLPIGAAVARIAILIETGTLLTLPYQLAIAADGLLMLALYHKVYESQKPGEKKVKAGIGIMVATIISILILLWP